MAGGLARVLQGHEVGGELPAQLVDGREQLVAALDEDARGGELGAS